MSGAAEQDREQQYEDDFEKDLDWLISEEGRSDDQEPEDEDIEAKIDKELEDEEELETDGVEDRWPSPMEPLDSLTDGGNACESLPLTLPVSTAPPPLPTEPLPSTMPISTDPPPPPIDDSLSLVPPQPEEEKRYILEKIQQANQQLKAQAAPDQSRRRRLQFKDRLVDLVVPPLEYEQETTPQRSSEEERDVSGRMSELQISQQEDALTGDGAGREGRVLVEKDGKFDLVSLREVESQGLLPPLNCSQGDTSHSTRQNEPSSITTPRPCSGISLGTEPLYTPKPPPLTKNRPNSAGFNQRSVGGRATKRRVQSASNTLSHTTFTLSPEQKHLQLKQQQRRDRMRREEEERRREEEAQKRQENELAFRAWLQRKREQLQEERRVHRAQEMEKTNCKTDQCDPQEAFKLWLKRKQEQQVKDRQLEEMKRLEEESSYYLHNQEESERAFKLWLKRKHAEKRAEMRVARERSRRLVMEARRARRMQDLLCTVSEAKSFRFTDHYGYHY
ncbi:hypothetical protein JZ751_029140 [Albula glossodonta]|uniref:Coiled-coil domain-containing protein 181 n=1 Tax=Albula glossodonta TaxID=121402 RepID=A0A8T2P5P1_9TELE|nr:hypothetical protein JZ751_029140 [Albula glossodonta]